MYFHRTRTMNMNDIVQSVKLISSTKDSLFVQWSIQELGIPYITGYKITYQAVGSNILQDIAILDQSATSYDITTLHEDTDYKICVEVITKDVAEGTTIHQCIEASTATDSLSVALGSTFGAFLALAIIIFFVFIAKWQHQRKLRNQRAARCESTGDSLDNMVHVEPDYEMSEISLHVPEESLKLDYSHTSTMLQESLTSNGTLHRNQLSRGRSCDCEVEPSVSRMDNANGPQQLDGFVTVHEPPDTRRIRDQLRNANGCRSFSLDMEQGQPKASSALRHQISQPYINFSTTLPDPIPQTSSGDRAPDVRPKEKALMDLTHMYANKKLFEQPSTGLRPNLSCNW